MMQLTDRIIGPSRGELTAARYRFRNGLRLPDILEYINHVYDLCKADDMPDFALVIGQFDLETGTATSYWWKERLNPAGIGITGDANQNNASAYFTPKSAARAHVAHLILYATGNINRGGLTPDDDPRYKNYLIKYGNRPSAITVNDLSAKWAVGSDYGQKICNRANEIFQGLPDQGNPVPPPSAPVGGNMKAYRFIGLDKDVWLPDDILVQIDIVPASRTNVRSNQVFTGQNKTTWHDTGNSGSTADSERNWLHKYMPTTSKAGYNFAADGVARTVDGKLYRGKIIQLTPLNEVTWAAGTAEGNRMSWHIEQCFGGANVWTNSLYVNSYLHGGLMAAKGWTTSALVQHNVWYGKNCPGQIRAMGIWATAVKMADEARARAAGGGVSGPTYVKPSPILVNGVAWDGKSDVTINNIQFFEDARAVTAAAVLNVRQYAGATSAQTGPAIAAGTSFNVLGWCNGELVGEEARWWIRDDFSRVWVGGTVEKPEDRVVPEPEPLPDTDGLFRIVNGRVYYPASDEIREVITENEAKLYKYASLTSEVVKTVPAGTTLTVEYWTLGDVQDEEVVWWVLADEQGRDAIAYGARVHATDTLARPE